MANKDQTPGTSPGTEQGAAVDAGALDAAKAAEMDEKLARLAEAEDAMAKRLERLDALEQQQQERMTVMAAMEAELREKLEAQTGEGVAGGPALVREEAPPPKMVKIRLHKGKHTKSDVFVAVNGHRFQIQRGVEVEVPDYIAEVLRNSERQDDMTEEYKAALRRRYEEKTQRLMMPG